MWRPDGAGWCARVGLLAPHFDPVPETEFCAMAPEGVFNPCGTGAAWHLRPRRQLQSEAWAGCGAFVCRASHVDNAATLLASIPTNVIVYAYTGSSYLLGGDGDAALKARLEIWAAYAKTVDVALKMTLDAIATDCK